MLYWLFIGINSFLVPDGRLKTPEFFVVCVRKVQLRVPSVIDDSKFAKWVKRNSFALLRSYFVSIVYFYGVHLWVSEILFSPYKIKSNWKKKLGEVFVWANPASQDTEYSV